jgi:elongation factor 3
MQSYKPELNSPFSIKYTILPVIFEKMSSKHKWPIRLEAVQLLGLYVTFYPEQITACLPEIIPKLTNCANDARKDISLAAEDVLKNICLCMDNKDLEPFIPSLVSCLTRPEEIQECVHKLSATTFVQAIEQPTLAILVPILERGLRENSYATRRRTSIICENMCKLIENPAHVKPFLPTLLPMLERVKNETSDPEVREVCNRSYQTLSKVSEQAKNIKTIEPEHVINMICEIIKDEIIDEEKKAAIDFVAKNAAFAVDMGVFDNHVWNEKIVTNYLESHFPDANSICEILLEKLSQKIIEETDEEDESMDLCKCNFSLAYGGKILLNQANLHLKKGHRYGLCGPNGCGKSTLLRAIGNDQVDGFPSKDIVRTAFVEHDLDGSLSDLKVLDYLIATLEKENIQATEEMAREQLNNFGFTETMQNAPISSLSGGWRMKLALGRAILQKPDILLLDEPTNHLDVINVKWLVDYLNSQNKISSIIVSHDTKFLDNVCTDIIHYDSFKLKRYRGNLSEFVKTHPETQSYYSLDATQYKFKFPEPGFLEGVNSKGKAILKMTNVNFTYPGTDKQILKDTSVVCSLSSRVGCIGPNGAGKSTLIKVLTGELVPQSGNVWKHPNVRIAYVAQHAFHHIEEHLDMTPSEYIQWRFAGGDDKEAEDKASRKITDEEEKAMASQVVLDGSKFVVEQVLNRRKLKNSAEYEVSFVGMSPDKNKWLPRKWLEDNGFGKLVNQVDAREAAAAGLHSTPLTASNIAKHLEAIGLDSEFTLHHRMKGLSGGQKVKVVIGAACWMHPHLIVLDEPTNYLDRDSLGGLAGALKDFGGGVVIISHAGEFIDATTTEKWIVGGGDVKIEGETWSVSTTKLAKGDHLEETVDAAGNIIKVAKQLSEQEKKRADKEKMKRRKEKAKARKRGEVVSSDSEDYE